MGLGPPKRGQNGVILGSFWGQVIMVWSVFESVPRGQMGVIPGIRPFRVHPEIVVLDPRLTKFR